MPIYALNNILYLGKLPEELKDLTIVEEVCIARARILLNMIKLDSKGASGNSTRECSNISTKSRQNFAIFTSIAYIK
jgi:hypothetical protein